VSVEVDADAAGIGTTWCHHARGADVGLGVVELERLEVDYRQRLDATRARFATLEPLAR
jgi:hypothetical protein